MRVAVTLEQLWHRVPGGTATSTIGLLGALRTGHSELDLVAVTARHSGAPPAPWTSPVPLRPLPLPRALLYETWHLPVWRGPGVELATGAVDVVHATAIAYPATAAPVVVTVHDLAFLADPGFATRHGRRFFRRGAALARDHARLIVVPSDATAAECRAAGFDAGRIRVVPWGVDREPVPPDDVERVRAKHGLDRPYVLFCGTLEPRKNLGGLVRALVRLDRHDVDLALVGPDGWATDVRALLGPLGSRARPLGYVPGHERDALMAGARVFAYPSLREGFGLPVLEAMAQGAAVVTSSVTATAEVVAEAGVTVVPTDVEALAGAIGDLLDDPARAGALGEAARARAATFTWSRAADGYAAAYAEAVS
jgi:glycosyltransferase involved in cell wall biosynthesis